MTRICFVSTQLPELTPGGGIGAVTKRLAIALEHQGNEITICVLRTGNPLSGKVQQEYRDARINLIEIDYDFSTASPWWLAAQLEVSNYLLSESFDLIICQEWQGLLSLYANLNASTSPVISWLHGGQLYDNIGSKKGIHIPNQLIDMNLEEIQISKSVAIVSPSRYLPEFYKQFGWKFSDVTIIPYYFPAYIDEATRTQTSEVPRIAFVSALSKRKGFDLAVQKLRELHQSGVDFVFMIYGHYLDIDPDEITKMLLGSGFKFEFHQELSTSEIWKQLSTFNATLLSLSRLDNSPSVIYEALANGCKVLVTDTQGGIEFTSLFPGMMMDINSSETIELKDFILKSVDTPTETLEALNTSITEDWNELIKRVTNTKVQINLKPEKSIPHPNISVVLITKNRFDFVKEAILSVVNQSLLPIELILIEDLSDGPTDLKKWIDSNEFPFFVNYRSVHYADKLDLEPQKGQHKAAVSRNLGANISKGDLVAFLDDDNLFLPNHLERCFAVLSESDANAVVPNLAQVFSQTPLNLGMAPTQTAVMAGGQFAELNLLVNVTMDSHILIKRADFLYLNGFPLESSPEDWALGIKIIGANLKFVGTGSATILYRLNSDGIQSQLSLSSRNWIELTRESSGLQLSGFKLSTFAKLSQQALAMPISSNIENDIPIFFKTLIRLAKTRSFREILRLINKAAQRL